MIYESNLKIFVFCMLVRQNKTRTGQLITTNQDCTKNNLYLL